MRTNVKPAQNGKKATNLLQPKRMHVRTSAIKTVKEEAGRSRDTCSELYVIRGCYLWWSSRDSARKGVNIAIMTESTAFLVINNILHYYEV